MWNWKFLLPSVILLMITLSAFTDILKNRRKSDEFFKCKDESGDGSVICSFMDHDDICDILSVTKISQGGNFTSAETLIVKIHSLNMPENLPSMKLIILIIF